MANNLDLKVVLAAVDRVTAPLKKIDASSSGVTKALKANRDQVKQLKAAQKDTQSFRKMQGAMKDNSEALQRAEDRLKGMRSELKKTDAPTSKFQAQFKKASDEVARLTQKSDEQRRSLGDVRTRLKEAGVSTTNLTAGEKKLADQLAKTNARIKSQQDFLGQLGKADIGGKFNTMTSEVGRFARRATMLGGAAAGGIFALANSTATLGDNVAKTADKMGIALGPYQELIYAGERSGISGEKMNSNMVAFVKRIGEAKQGSGAAKKAYDQLGISSERLAEMTPDDALAVVADRLASVESQTDRVALASQIFSREGVGMVNMLKDGSAGLSQLRAEARKTGYVLSDQAARDAEVFKDRMLDAQLAMAGMKNTIGSELMPIISGLMADMSGWMGENRDRVKAFAKEFGEGLRDAVPTLKNMAKGLWSVATTISAITAWVANLVGGFDNLGIIMGTIFAGKALMSIVMFAVAIGKGVVAVAGLAGALPAVAVGIKAIGLALMANPIGLVTAGIATGALLIWKYWEPISGFFSGLGDSIISGLGVALDWIKSTFLAPIKAIKDTLGGAWDAMFGGSDDAATKVAKVGKAARNAAGAAAIGASAVSPAVADVQFDNRPPVTAAAASGAAQGGDQVAITINAAPGMDEAAIARQVQAMLAQRDREKASRRRSALYDTE